MSFDHALRGCLFVEKLDFPFGGISKSPIENKVLFSLGNQTRATPRRGRGSKIFA